MVSPRTQCCHIGMPEKSDQGPRCAHRLTVSLLATSLCLAFTGCNSFSNRTLVKQLQGENERLISEFRAQKDLSNRLAERNQLLEGRLAESEKLIARELGASRISSLPSARLGSGSNTSRAARSLEGASDSFGGANSTSAPGSAGAALDTSLRWESR